MHFTWAGSCACGHDLYQILHTWGNFIPTAGRTAGIFLFVIFFFFYTVCISIGEIFKKCPCFYRKVYPAHVLVFVFDCVQRWLVRAKEHLRTYLQEQQGRGPGRRKSQVNLFRKMMSSSDVSRLFNISISILQTGRKSHLVLLSSNLLFKYLFTLLLF